MEKMMKIPLGFHFAPTDEELISCYLLRRAMALPLMPSGHDHRHILETDLYGDKADPWLVFQDIPDSRWNDISDDQDKRVIYVVTKLTKISKGKTRIARRAGCGTWSGQTPPKKIYNKSTGQWVGTMRMLSFERAAKGEEHHHDPRDQHHWIMHEYSLDGIYNNNNNSNKLDKEYVICRITRLFKGINNKSRNNNIINGTSAQQLVHEEEEEEDVVHVPAAAVIPPSCHPNKKRKREIINMQQLVDQGHRRCYPRDVSSHAGEEIADHDHPPPVIIGHHREKELGGESSPVLDQMAHDQQQMGNNDSSDPDFDDWMSSLDNVLVEEEPEEEEDHDTQASASNLQVESVSVLETTMAQHADDEHYEASTAIAAADWMTLLDDVQLLPDDDEDEDQHSNHNNWTTTAFNLDHLDLFEELCY